MCASQRNARQRLLLLLTHARRMLAVYADYTLERYSTHAEDLSNSATPEAFRDGLADVVTAAAKARAPQPPAAAPGGRS